MKITLKHNGLLAQLTAFPSRPDGYRDRRIPTDLCGLVTSCTLGATLAACFVAVGVILAGTFVIFPALVLLVWAQSGYLFEGVILAFPALALGVALFIVARVLTEGRTTPRVLANVTEAYRGFKERYCPLIQFTKEK